MAVTTDFGRGFRPGHAVPDALPPPEALYLPTFSHFLILNKTSFSVSLSSLSSLPLSRSLSILLIVILVT